MGRTVLDRALDTVIGATGDRLRPVGFSRRGSILRVFNDGNCGIVEFQRSRKSSHERLLFTVNVGVVCGRLLDPNSQHLQRARIVDAHVRQRIGMLMTGRKDRWWEISGSADLGSLAAEVSESIMNEAVPFIQHYISTDAIAELWASGQSPGLTERERVNLLAKLNAVCKGGGP